MMGGVFDRLNNKVGGDQNEGGISPIELAKLPPVQRQLMRLLLRELEMTDKALHESIAEIPEDKRPSDSDMDTALKELAREGWVIKMGEGDKITYKANIRRKAPSTLAKSLWSALDSKIEETKATPKPDAPAGTAAPAAPATDSEPKP
jgi:hypothetical protein